MKIKTPIDQKISGEGWNGSLKWRPGFTWEWQAKFDAAQKYIDSEVLRLSDPYLPKREGVLRSLGILGTVPGSGEVVWNGPYARYLYYGKVMVGRAPKIVTNKDLQFSGAPMRGAFWFERMKADRQNEILDGARKIMRG